MARPPALSADRKTALVLAVLSGEMSAAEAARSAGVSDQAVGVWKRRFVEAGRASLEWGIHQRPSAEIQLSNEVAELKRALGDSYLQLRAMRAALRGNQIGPIARPLRSA